MHLHGALAVLFLCAPVAAQDYLPVPERLAVLVGQVEAGDQTARPRLEREGRSLFVWAAQRRLPHDIAHLVARVGLAVGTPFSSIDSGRISRNELFWRSGVIHALHDALAADSGDIKAASRLESFAPYPHIWIEPERELRHLRALAARNTSLPSVLAIAWLGMELERGDPAAAGMALQRIGVESVAASRWHHLAARVAYANGDSLAEHHYWTGAGAIRSTEDAAIYRADIAWIADSMELAEWDALPPGDNVHAVWLRKFWTGRDLADSRLPGTRLTDHFSRWRLALRDYRWDREGLRVAGRSPALEMGLEYNWKDTPFPKLEHSSQISYASRYRPVSLVLDDRGNAVMRHGIPDQEAQLPGITGFGQTLLAWQRPEGPLVMSFSSPAISTANQQPSGLWGMIARNMPVGDLLVACQVDAGLCGLAGLVESGGNVALQAERTRSRYENTRRVAETTDGNPERFARKLDSYVQVYGIPGGGVLVSYAIRAHELDDGMAALRVVVGDRGAGEIVGSLRADRRWALPADPDAFLSGWMEVTTPPGTWQVGVVLSDLKHERGNGNSFAAVPAVATGNSGPLRFGDPILGRLESGLGWNRQGRSIPLNPTGAWRADEEGVLDVEVFGLVPGREYRLSIEIREGGGANGRSRLVIDETVAPENTTMVLQRNIAFDNLEPATYRLVIRITDPVDAVSVQRDRVVPIVK